MSVNLKHPSGGTLTPNKTMKPKSYLEYLKQHKSQIEWSEWELGEEGLKRRFYWSNEKPRGLSDYKRICSRRLECS